MPIGARDRITDQDSPVSGLSLRTIAEAVPPVSMATALLFYFGWARSDVQARALGINESVLRMSVTDYLLRSISSLYLPLVTCISVALICIAVQYRFRRLLATPAFPRVCRRVAVALGGTAPALPVLALWLERIHPPLRSLLVPLACAIAVLMAAYLGWILRTIAALRIRQLPERAAHDAAYRPTTKLLIGLLVGLLIFWELSGYAAVVGRGLARQITDNLRALPAVIVYSQTDLLISAPGVTVDAYQGEHLAYRYAYGGLRFLQYSGETYYLLPENWTQDHKVVIVIRDSPELRIEFHGTG
ncbi:hypothetical protein GA0070624_3946 [Micromonospora rhizosphaerae]|uniref:Uncharacterized protein n=1 Tax=Micromonospora rhizosphaerae TaxID=568872 RepID=A0A1C6SK61_9ACTN|nr:hypothetical protein [Micromonospora rhizosphaerae]SCL29765.1 hypothetical protein GA0070624_3946 [Micromonospora rhizosphaerae]